MQSNKNGEKKKIKAKENLNNRNRKNTLNKGERDNEMMKRKIWFCRIDKKVKVEGMRKRLRGAEKENERKVERFGERWKEIEIENRKRK